MECPTSVDEHKKEKEEFSLCIKDGRGNIYLDGAAVVVIFFAVAVVVAIVLAVCWFSSVRQERDKWQTRLDEAKLHHEEHAREWKRAQCAQLEAAQKKNSAIERELAKYQQIVANATRLLLSHNESVAVRQVSCAPAKNRLCAGPAHRVQELRSLDSTCHLVMQCDYNLVQYFHHPTTGARSPVWATDTSMLKRGEYVMELDPKVGLLVVDKANGDKASFQAHFPHDEPLKEHEVYVSMELAVSGRIVFHKE